MPLLCIALIRFRIFTIETFVFISIHCRVINEFIYSFNKYI